MINKQYYLNGNTLTLKATFYDLEEKKIDPQLVKLIFYDNKYNRTQEIVLSDTNRIEEGVFLYDFIIPFATGKQRYIYEWYSEIGGKPSLNRSSFITSFM